MMLQLHAEFSPRKIDQFRRQIRLAIYRTESHLQSSAVMSNFEILVFCNYDDTKNLLKRAYTGLYDTFNPLYPRSSKIYVDTRRIDTIVSGSYFIYRKMSLSDALTIGRRICRIPEKKCSRL